MDHLQKVLILLLVAGIPAAAPPLIGSPPGLCFTVGQITYQVASGLSRADLRVKIVAPRTHPDLRIQLVDDVQSADFALVDDFEAGDGDACPAGGAIIKRVRVVADTQASDITVALSNEPSLDGLKLYVYSARFGHRDAAALFAAVKHDQGKALFDVGETADSW